jgi:hypothetical protein
METEVVWLGAMDAELAALSGPHPLRPDESGQPIGQETEGVWPFWIHGHRESLGAVTGLCERYPILSRWNFRQHRAASGRPRREDRAAVLLKVHEDIAEGAVVLVTYVSDQVNGLRHLRLRISETIVKSKLFVMLLAYDMV